MTVSGLRCAKDVEYLELPIMVCVCWQGRALANISYPMARSAAMTGNVPLPGSVRHNNLWMVAAVGPCAEKRKEKEVGLHTRVPIRRS